MKKTLWKQSSRSLRMEQLENRELLSATTWSNAIDADAAVAAEMSTALSNATAEAIDLTLVTTLQDKVDATDGIVSLREALQYIANDATLDGTITFAPELDGKTITLTQGELQFTNNSLATIEMPEGRAITIDASGLENGITIDAQGKSRVFNVFATQDADPFVPTFKNLTIVNGAVTGDGAAIYADGYTVTLADCDFEGNVATGNGGAVYAKKVTATNSTFTDNEAGGNGGALYVNSYGKMATASTFAGNKAGGDGGAIYNNSNSWLTVEANFSGNSATGNGGAVYAKGQLTVTGDFTKNIAGVDGGAIYTNGSNGSFTSSTFAENTATTGSGGALYVGGANNTFDNLTFTKNVAGANGGAVYVYGSNNAFDSTSFTGNTATADGGAVYFNAVQGKAPGSARQPLTNLTFDGNQAGGSGGAIYGGGTSTMFENLTVVNNTAGVDGGGLYLSGQLTNALIADNTATGKGGGVYGASGQKFYNVTIAGNKAASGAGVSFAYGNGTYGRFYNSIILNNFDANGAVSDIAPNVSQFGTARPLGYNVLSSYDDWCSDAVGVSENVIVYTGDVDKVFANAAEGDYTLAFGSPAINAGNKAYFEGEYQMGAVDLGAFESPYAILAQPKYTVTVNDSDSETLKGSITITVEPQEGATDYTVTIGTKGGWIWDMQSVQLGAITENTSVTFDELDPNAEYIMWVTPIGDDVWATPEIANPLNDVYTTKSVQLATPKLDELVTLTANSISFDFAQDNDGKASSYFVLYQKAGDAGWKFSPAKAGETFTIDGLEIGGTYNVMAVAYGDKGDDPTYLDSLFSNAYTFTTPKYDLAAPSIEVVSVNKSEAADNASITVKVGDVEYAENYTVYYTTENPYAEDGSLKDKDVVKWTSGGSFADKSFADNEDKTYVHTVSGLKANTTYWFYAEVSADETYYNSNDSVVVSEMTKPVYLTAPKVTLTPNAYTANDLTTSVTASFDAVENATGYNVYYILDANYTQDLSKWEKWDKIDVAEGKVSATITGLDPYAKYQVLAVAVGDGSLYKNSNDTKQDGPKYDGERHVTTVKAQLAKPTFTVEGVKANREALLVTIEEVNKAVSYKVSWVDDQDETQTVELTDGALTYTIEGLTVNTSYAVTVEAIGSEAYVASTATVAGKTLKYDMPFGLPTISVVAGSVTDTKVEVEVGGVYREEVVTKEVDKTDADGNLVYDEETGEVVKETITETIKVYDVATNGYAIEYVLADVYANAENKAAVVWSSVDAKDGKNSVEGLTPNREYIFRAVAKETDFYYASISDVDTATTQYALLSAPSLSVTPNENCVGSSSVTVGITEIDEAADTYTLQYKLEGADTWASIKFDAAGSYVVDGFLPNKKYDFRVQANVNDADTHKPNGDYDYVLGVQTKRAHLNAPTNVNVIGTSQSELTVTFDKVDNAAFYVYQYRVKGSTAWSATTVVNDATSFTIKGENVVFGTEYEVLLQAVATGDYLPSSPVISVGKTLNQTLDAPSIEFTKVGSSSITVVLGEVANATGYVVQYKAADATEWLTIDAKVGENLISGLAPNTYYVFQATALGDDSYNDGVSAQTWQNTKKGSITLDDSNVTITATSDSITIDVELGDKFDNYPYLVLQYCKNDGVSQWVYQTIDNTQLAYTFSGLDLGTSYLVKVEAIGDADHDNSNIYTKVVSTEKLGVLDAPTLSATQVDASTITVTLGEVADATHGYTLQYSTGNDEWTTVENAVVGVNTISGLLPNQTYVFRAFANETAVYSASEATDATATTKPQTPGAITFSQYKGGAEGALDGSYTRVRWAYCDNAPTYELWYAVSGSLDWTVVNCDATLVKPSGEVDQTNAGAFLYDLTPGVEYTFMVRAVDPNNAENVSDFSASATFRMMASPEVAEPTFDPTTGKLQFSWSTDEANVTKYRAEVSTTPFESVNLTTDRVYSGTNTSFEFNSLNAVQTYYFRVCAYNADGVVSGWTYSEYSFTTPSKLSFTQYQDWVRVRWADVENESGYRVEYRAVGETEWTLAQTAKANATSGAIYGLTAGTTYEYRVVATFNKVADGAASEATTFAMLAAPTVNEPTFSATGDRVTFTWDAVEGAVTYRVELSGANLSKTRAYTLNANTMKQDFTGLAAGTYTFRVRANQASGEGNSDWTTFEFTIPAKSDSVLDTDVVSEAFVDLFAEEAEDDFWFEFEEALGGRSK